MDKKVAYLNFRDLQPKKTPEELREFQYKKLKKMLDQQTNESYKEESRKLDQQLRAQNQRPKLCEKPNNLPPPGYDRETVRRGKIFATEEENFYVAQLIDLTKELTAK